MNIIQRQIIRFKTDPLDVSIDRVIGGMQKGVKLLSNTVEPFSEAYAETQQEIDHYKAENPQLPIGRVETAPSLRSETSVNPDLQGFANSCVLRHRAYDYGNSPDEKKTTNDHELLNNGVVKSSYEIPKECCLGEGYPKNITVKTDLKTKETVVDFEGED